MRQIKLSGRGGKYVALVDDADYALVAPYTWKAFRNTTKTVIYAAYRKRVAGPDGQTKRQWVKMHRLILGFPPYHIDHKNHDGLDNQRHNLRPATAAQNRTNARLRPNKVGFRGVSAKKGSTFTASITAGGVVHYLGSFPRADLAGQAYDAAAMKLHGEFATLNFQ